MIHEYDFLVIGSGLAGMSFALKVADKGKVAILCKNKLEEANTNLAQGGIASVTNTAADNFEKHIQDTLIAGDGLCNEAVVRKVVEDAPREIKQLVDWGVDFDKDESGHFDLHREGGHSEFRILHHKDSTGAEVQHTLMKRIQQHPNIDVFEEFYAIEIITQHHLGQLVKHTTPDIECYGAYVLEPKKHTVHTFLSKVTLMATGGIGQIYQTTTNPSEFMHKYDKRGSLAPRDIVARAIDTEMKLAGSDYVYLDVTHKNADETKEHFPMIYDKCLSLGIDIAKDYIPVVPAAHYLCGGIVVDTNARSSIRHLYAAGECSCTGLHGANRLASNSLLEAIVYADAAARDALSKINSLSINREVPDWNDEGTSLNEEMVLITQSKKEVGQIMSNYVGIVRSNLRLKRAFDRLELLYKETKDLYERSIVTREICELRNIINTAYLVIKMAMERKESRGLHYTIDYPDKIVE